MYTYNAKLVRWVDGDTIVVDIDLGFSVMRRERLRLARINTEEINSAIVRERRRAKHARAVGKKFCQEGSGVVVHTKKSKKDMYARYIAEVFFRGQNISDYLLAKGVAEKFLQK